MKTRGTGLGWIIRMWAHDMRRKVVPGFRGYLTVDHIVPRKEKGPHCIGNVQAIPRLVNELKGDLSQEELFEQPNRAVGKYLKYTKGIRCEPCRYDCRQCPFGDYLSDMAYEYSAWVPENYDKPLE